MEKFAENIWIALSERYSEVYLERLRWKGARKVTHENQMSRKRSRGVLVRRAKGHVLDFHPARLWISEKFVKPPVVLAGVSHPK